MSLFLPFLKAEAVQPLVAEQLIRDGSMSGTKRQARERILVDRAGHRIQGLRHDPCLSGFLDEFDRADAEGLGQLVDQLLAEVKRSGTLGGFGLELAMANLAMDVVAPRTVLCEKKEGLCKAPGDIWLDSAGRRYEFQCKHSLNWTVELSINDALDRIFAATKNCAPGYLYTLTPNIAGDRKEWLGFADWVIANYKSWSIGQVHSYKIEGQHLADFALMQTRKHPGLVSGMQSTPGGGQVLCIDLLKKKLRDAFSEARRSISAIASPTQINCVVVDYDNWIIDVDDIFQGLYGHVVFDYDGAQMQPRTVWDGLFYTEQPDLYTAVIFTRARDCNPYQAQATVFPNPKWLQECKAAFADFPRTKVVTSTADVGL